MEIVFLGLAPKLNSNENLGHLEIEVFLINLFKKLKVIPNHLVNVSMLLRIMRIEVNKCGTCCLGTVT